jgi:RimJ/RimL family protein N-acetyltransferase
MASGPRLETPRLILRPPAEQDFEPWCAFAADPEASRFLGGPQPPEITWRAFCTMAGAWSLFGFGMFSAIEKETGRWIGRLGPWQPLGWPGTEVAWGLAREAWGKGYATEGATAAIDWAFGHLGWSEVVHSIAPQNTASQAVAQRLGSANRGPGRLPPPMQDSPVDIWAQTRAQWRARAR